MARKKKEVYHVKPLTEGKKNIISALIDEYDIETAEDIQPGFPRIHTSLTLTIRPETLGNIELNCIFTCHRIHSVV